MASRLLEEGKDAKAEEADQPIRSVCRALAVLKTINRLGGPRLQEIADATDLPYPTVFRIVRTLVHEGMVEQEHDRKRYHVTPLVTSLSSGFQEEDLLLAVAKEPMRRFTDEHLWPVALTSRVGNLMMVKHSTSPFTTQTFTRYYQGYTHPLLECASGRAYLAFCDPREREAILEGLQRASGGTHSLTMQQVRQGTMLERIRKTGFASLARTNYNETPGKTSAFAVPVMPEGRIVGCLTLVFFASAMSMERAIADYGEPLRILSREVAERLSKARQAAA